MANENRRFDWCTKNIGRTINNNDFNKFAIKRSQLERPVLPTQERRYYNPNIFTPTQLYVLSTMLLVPIISRESK